MASRPLHAMRAVAFPCLLALVGSLLGAPAVAQAAEAPPADLAKWKKEDVEKAQAFAREFFDDVAAGRSDEAIAALDLDAMLAIVFDGLGSDAERKEMREGAKKTMGPSLVQGFAAMLAGEQCLKRTLVVDGKPRVRFRFVGDQGIAFLDVELGWRNGNWAILDLHNLSFGISTVEGMRNMAVLLSGRESPGLFARLLGTKSVLAEDCERLEALAKASQRGDYVRGKAAHDALSEDLKATLLVTSMHLQLVMNGPDEAAYVAALERAVEQFPAPRFRMTMIDAHFLRKRWKEAVACIDDTMKGIEQDGTLFALRASILLQDGDVAAARKSAAEAMQLDPDSEYVLTRCLDVLLAAKDWTAVVGVLQKLEKTGKFAFQGNLEGEIWAEFVKQPESKPWR